MIRFKHFIREAEGLKLDLGKVKEINIELFDIVKNSKPDATLATIFEPIQSLLLQYDITIPAPTKLINTKGEKRFPCTPYTNIELVVKWAQKDENFQLTDADLQTVQGLKEAKSLQSNFMNRTQGQLAK